MRVSRKASSAEPSQEEIENLKHDADVAAGRVKTSLPASSAVLFSEFFVFEMRFYCKGSCPGSRVPASLASRRVPLRVLTSVVLSLKVPRRE